MPLAQGRDGDRLEDYWTLRTGVGHWHTAERPIEISGPDAEKFCSLVLTKDIRQLCSRCCVYGLACYPDGGLIVDGILVRFAHERFWYVQADGGIFPLLVAHGMAFDVDVFDPNVWGNQVQGPLSMEFFATLADDGLPKPFDYFGRANIRMGGNLSQSPAPDGRETLVGNTTLIRSWWIARGYGLT